MFNVKIGVAFTSFILKLLFLGILCFYLSVNSKEITGNEEGERWGMQQRSPASLEPGLWLKSHQGVPQKCSNFTHKTVLR